MQTGYTATARALHWIVALIVLGMIPAGKIMVEEGLPRGLQDALFLFHKNAGVIVLVLMIVRLVWRWLNPPPPLPASVPEWQARAAHLTHVLLYALIFVMAVSGYVRVVAGGFPLELTDALGLPRLLPKVESLGNAASTVHYLAHYAVIALIALHIGAALFHGIVRRDGVFGRMWRG
ncbi:cytochrome B [Cereibacter changlensis JA139]|uniref:Cytochrome B n=2 Tax=Cereibacter changlensis TaxID=402884 RepID=A0A2T4JV54_9RHOB|nr:cytochrome b [Cereibacter changlensis]PTE21687.1 cytochrome B [Cereibacter changlensis JA139]PZX53656.1 cytochrome b561 [Cereibacter changlensis]